MSLDEFFDKYEATRTLRDHLKVNLDVFGIELDGDSKEELMRMNLISIRQCLEDFGASNEELGDE